MSITSLLSSYDGHQLSDKYMKSNLAKLGTQIATRNQVLKYLAEVAQRRRSRVVAMYNSDLDLLIDGNDQDLMVFPIDDRLPNRAHGCMETGNVKNFRISGLENHVNRLFNSARILGIDVPMTREQVAHKIHDMSHLAYAILERENHPDIASQVMVLKIWVSTGLGDFDIYGCDKKPILYAALYIPAPTPEVEAVKEYIHPDMWTTPDYFANAKTVNYLSLACMADYSKMRGGYLGIKTDQNSVILEGSISNIAFVLEDKTFAFPPLEKTIRGVTLTKALKIVEDQLLKEGLITSIQERQLRAEQLDSVREMFHLSNDHVVAILSVNDAQIGDGTIGPVCKRLQEQLEIARAGVKLAQGAVINGLEECQEK